MREAGRQTPVAPGLERLARSATSDPYTRLRATQALLYVSDAFAVDPPPAQRQSVAAARLKAGKALLSLDLHPVARDWLLAWLAEK